MSVNLDFVQQKLLLVNHLVQVFKLLDNLVMGVIVNKTLIVHLKHVNHLNVFLIVLAKFLMQMNVLVL